MAPRQRPEPARWPRPAHWAVLDCAAAVFFTLIVRALFGTALRPAGTSFWLGLAVAAALSLPVALRRRGPVLILGILLAESTVLSVAGLPPTAWALLPVAFVLYLAAAARPLAAGAAALGASIAVLAIVSLEMLARARSLHVSAGNVAVSVVGAGLALLIAWAIGVAVSQRRSLDQQLRAQQQRQVQADLDRAWRSVTEERLRIARELHDVIAHSLTVIAVQAGVGHHIIDTQPEEARAALGVIETTTRRALTEMRHMLGVLRQADGARAGPDATPAGAGSDDGLVPGDAWAGRADLVPAPGLADLNRLLAQISQAGVQVRVHVVGQPRDLAAGIDLAAYRIIQEALTNVVRHSGSSDCQLTVGYRDDEVFIEVTDRGAGRGARHGAAESLTQGHGIAGMRERVSLYGGQFRAASMNGTGFRVTAVLPAPSGDL